MWQVARFQLTRRIVRSLCDRGQFGTEATVSLSYLVLEGNFSISNTQSFNSASSGTTLVGQYPKKHSPTHTHPVHQTSFINFLHLLRSVAHPCSIYVLDSPFPQPLWPPDCSHLMGISKGHFILWKLVLNHVIRDVLPQHFVCTASVVSLKVITSSSHVVSIFVYNTMGVIHGVTCFVCNGRELRVSVDLPHATNICIINKCFDGVGWVAGRASSL